MIYRTLTQAHILRRGLRHRRMVTSLVDADRALFECVCLNCGFIFREQLVVQSGRGRAPATATQCRMMARVWKGYGESIGICPLCSDPKRTTASNRQNRGGFAR